MLVCTHFGLVTFVHQCIGGYLGCPSFGCSHCKVGKTQHADVLTTPT